MKARMCLLLSVLIIIAGLLGAMFVAVTGRGVEISILLVQVATVLVLVISAFLVWYQIAKTHEWNRRKAAQDLVHHMHTIGYYEAMERLEKIPCCNGGSVINTDDQSQTYSDVACGSNRKEIADCLSRILAFCEEIALGVRHEIYSDDIAYDYFGYLVPNIYRWSKPYIQEVREETHDPTIYIEMELLSDEWHERNEAGREKL